MTEPEHHPSTSVPEAGTDAVPGAAETAATATEAPPQPEAAPPPEPEPWTPERVLAWNAYYDLYVALGVLLLVFIVSATKIANSSLWSLLQAGRQMAVQRAPLMTDIFSYTEAGHRWINVPWLIELLYSQIYRLIAPDSLPRRPGELLQADQNAAGALVAINAMLRVLTALVLLSIRRAGPGLWWASICAALALGGMFGPPTGVTLGGIAGQPAVNPETWGLLFLAIELWLLHQTVNLGRRNAVLALIPLFLLWANVDDTFLTGLIVLAFAAIGGLQRDEETGKRPVGGLHADSDEAGQAPLPPRRGFLLLALCAVVCLVNPSFHRVYAVALSPITQLFAPKGTPLLFEQISLFGPTFRSRELHYRWYLAEYLILVGLAVGSFFLNRRRFSLGRFLTFAVVAVLYAAVQRFNSAFALVWAVTMTLNGQEWYQDRFGVEGRLGRGWALWSVGGRALSIILICGFAVKGLTGYGSLPGEPLFGFGANADLFPFEAADHLRIAEIRGNVLNTSTSQGDALIWRGFPLRKSFIDSRSHVFTTELRSEFEKLRQALRDDKVEEYRPILDRYAISAVMIDPDRGAPVTYERLVESPNWIRFYDDGNVVMFGRSDSKGPDLAYFQAHKLDAQNLAYRRKQLVESTDRPPRPVTSFDRAFYDRVFQSRYLVGPQPHVRSAYRWLESGPNTRALPDPARCLLAVREARTALARKPDDPSAFRVLAEAYRLLLRHESAILAGETLTSANYDRIVPQPTLLSTRFTELVTALRYAIQTTPPPTSTDARHSLAELQLELGDLYFLMGMLDLARDQYQAAIDLVSKADISQELSLRMSQLDEQIRDAQTRMKALPEAALANPVIKAQRAMSLGLVSMAIDELYEADQAAVSVGIVRPTLLDLYCQTGQPDRAIDLLGNTEDPTLSTGPGTAARRQGLVSFLIGNYDYAASLWRDRAIPSLRGAQAGLALMTGQNFLRGEVSQATRSFLELPDQVTTEATWEMDLGLGLLESGDPAQAAEHLTKALTLSPRLVTRPVIEYYLDTPRLGKPAPPAPPENSEQAGAPARAEAPAGGNAKDADRPKESGKKEDDRTGEADKKVNASDKDARSRPK